MTVDAALVLVGHGSHLNPQSARPVYDHADEIRSRGAFAEVREAFWKEEPSPREVLRTVERDEVYVVPLFTSEGYFTEQVIPRELRVADGRELAGDKSVHYTDPVGTHDAMTDVVVRRAERVTDDPEVGESVGLAVVGHGTERNANSARATRTHAERLRERDRFAEVRALFMDEEPRIDDLTDHFESDELVVVPLFVADGYHTQEDIPEDAGLTDDASAGYDVPADVDGRTVWYAGAVGTEPLVADVVLERAGDAGADVEGTSSGGVSIEGTSGERVEVRGTDSEVDGTDSPATRAVRESLADRQMTDHQAAFLEWLVDGDDANLPSTRTWGQLAITVSGDGEDRRYEVRHVEDRSTDAAVLDSHDDPVAARDLSRFTADGEYRPLSTAPTLQSGWLFSGLDGREVCRVVDEVYPAAVANWHREREGDLDVSHFAETADRQTGIYAEVEELDRDALERAATACCADSQCLKRRAWDAADGDELDAPRGDGEFPCREACSLFVAAAREFLHAERREESHDENEQSESLDGDRTAVRDGEVSDPANRFRVRYRRAKRATEEA